MGRSRRLRRRRGLQAWVALFAIYALTTAVDAFPGSRYAGDEPHHLLTAASLASDGDVDLRDEYAGLDYAGYYPFLLDPQGEATEGRLNEPVGLGFPLLIAPAYAAGGPLAVELLLAAVAALAFVLSAALARRIVSEPWASAGVALIALSPPALAYATTVDPALTAGALLAGAMLLALRAREEPRLRYAVGGAVLLSALPWLDATYLIPGLPVAVLLVRSVSRRGRRVAALGVAEVMIASVIAWSTVNGVLYGGLLPSAADPPGERASDAEFPMGYVERLPRLAALWIDREVGLLRWAPVLALAFVAAWLLWRSRRERLARALPGRADAEVAAALALAVCAGQLLAAVLATPALDGFWFPGRHLAPVLPAAAPLVAWGLRRAPRAGAGLGGLTLLASAWLLVEASAEGWVTQRSSAPWGPLERLWPLYGTGSAWADAASAGLLLALAALVAREWRRRSASPAAGLRPG